MRLFLPSVRLLAVTFASVFALALSACGDDDDSNTAPDELPTGAVAVVGDYEITQDDFEHWYEIFALSNGAQKDAVPQPPDFTSCVATLKEAAPEPAKDQPITPDSQYREQCSQQYEMIRDQTLTYLITSQWVTDEAAKRNITVSDKEITEQFEQTKAQNFRNERQFERFLRSSGMSLDDIRARVRNNLLSQKLQEDVLRDADQVTNAEIAAYYKANSDRFAVPALRDALIVLTKTEAQAEAARRALEAGQSFAEVSERYSIDEPSKAEGGLLRNIAEGQQERAFDEALFAAREGELVGPVKTPFGWYVFRVTDSKPGSQQTLAQATPQIRQTLIQERSQKLNTDFSQEFQESYKAMTQCREGYIIAACDNAPTPTTPTVPQPDSQ